MQSALGTHAPSSHDELPLWDDPHALRALGGNAAARRAMRALFLAELPTQEERILHAIAAGDVQAAQDELHRLNASRGFIGSARMLAAVRALSDLPHDPACAARFRTQVAAVLGVIQPDS